MFTSYSITTFTPQGQRMNPEKVIFGFFIVLALTLNVGFFIGDMDNSTHHSAMELFLAIIVNLIATFLKWGDRSQLGAVLLATSLVADLQLMAAAVFWGIIFYASQTTGLYGADRVLDGKELATIISLSGGALVANIISVTLLVIETVMLRR